MLRRNDFVTTDPNAPASSHDAGRAHVDFAKILTFVKASRRTIVCWTITGLALALVYALTAVPEYTATADLILDARKIQVFKDAPVVGDSAIDAAQIESQVDILRSEALATSVVKQLKLQDDPEFVARRPYFLISLMRAALGIAEDPKPQSDYERERSAVRTLRENMTARRLGVTYILDISYQSTDPEKSARIANAFVNAYVVDQLDTKFQATKRATGWLQERIEELRNQSDAAARAVQEFKAKNNIVDIGNRGLVSDQQLEELNTQLVLASSHTAEMQARLERVLDILKAPAPGETLGSVSDTLTNPVILHLRQQYLDARKREAEFSQKYGATHLATVNLRNEMLELQRSILNEVRRIADSYRSDYEIAKTREDTINQSLKAQVRQADTMGQAQVTLKALESTANTYRIILENFLQKFTEAVQQQSFPVSDARLITAAEPPLSKSFPKTTLLALLGMMVGATCGVAHAMALRGLDRTIRSPRELEEKIGIECLSLVPVMPAEPDLLQGSQTKILPRRQVAAKPETLSTVLVDIRHIRQSNGSLRRSVIEPLSRFTESLRSVKTSVDLAAITRSLKFIGTVSALPGEGKSTVSANLAYLFANGGAKTLLIDGDLRNPTLSRNMAPQDALGLLQVIQGTVLLDAVLWSDPVTFLHFLPAGVSSRITNSADLLGSERTRTILNGMSATFDYIIIDLPPLGAAVDARAISPQIDGFIVIVEWGSTREDVLEEALTSMAVARDKIIGGVLNKVDFRKLNNVDNYSPGYYYNESYGRYGGGPER